MSLSHPTTALVKPGIHWTGAVDWHVKTFHGYETREGSTYNSYLILDEQPTIVDTVKLPFCQHMVDRVKSLIPLEKIKYVICNHLEYDHAGSLPQIMKMCPNATLIASKKGIENMEKVLGPVPGEKRAVSTGDTLNIGSRTLTFVETPMLHWPDSMMTYSASDKVLFSIDGFGQHIATSARFDDEVGEPAREAMIEYTANILGCFAPVIKRNLPALAKLDIDTICTAHGVIWRSKEGVEFAIKHYVDFSEGRHIKPKVLILFDTMYGSTESMARAIEAGAVSVGAEVRAISSGVRGVTEIAREAFDSAAVAVGSPTLNSGILPTVAGAVSYLKGLQLLKGKPCAAFGSYGWSNIGQKTLLDSLISAGGTKVGEMVAQNWRPDTAILDSCYELGRSLGQAALDKYHESQKK